LCDNGPVPYCLGTNGFGDVAGGPAGDFYHARLTSGQGDGKISENVFARGFHLVTLQDVARKAGVSIGTVSKALRQGVESERISQACRERVMAVCQELGYRPNHLARSLQAGKARALGSLFGEATENLENAVLWYATCAGMIATALKHGNQLVTIGTKPGESPIDAALESLDQRRVDGLVVPAFLLTPQRLKRLEASEAPIVLAGYPKSTQLPSVEIDDETGVVQAIEHLRQLGHRQILWIAPGDRHDFCEQRRMLAVRRVAAQRNVTLQEMAAGYMLRSMPRKEDQVRLTRQAVLAQWPRLRAAVTAVVAYNEAVALGVYAAAAELQLRIPTDLSVVAFDDFYACVAWPPMTVVSLMMYELGVRTVEVLLDMVGDRVAWKRLRGWRQRIPCRMTVRESTASPGNGK
jgi:LacI family transcriptional regulator